MANGNPAYHHTPFPQQLVIELTAACNQACVFCGRTYMRRPKKTMSSELFRRIVREVASESPFTEVWPTFMGEAMLLGDRLFDEISYARDAGCRKITLNTNGTRLDEKTVGSIVDCGLDRFIVSCDAHTEDTHARVRPANSEAASRGLRSIYRGIELLLQEVQRRRATRPIVELQFSIFEENEHEVDDFREYWLARGAVVKVRPKVHWSGTVTGAGSLDGQDRVPCLWALDSAAIHWNGSVVMCPVDCEGKYIAGNVALQSLKDIWNGPFLWLRELQMQHRFSELPEICRKCPDWHMKKARAYYPNESARERFEDYVNLGRQFMERHYWK